MSENHSFYNCNFILSQCNSMPLCIGIDGMGGSGKSTFSSIVAGIQQRDSGRLLLRGEDYAPTSSVDAAKQGKFLSKDDFRDRTKVSKTVIDLMDDLKLFGDIPQSNQMSLFDFTG